MAMSTTAKVATLSDLIHKAVSSGCLNHPLSHCHSQRNPHSTSSTSSEHRAISSTSEEEGNASKNGGEEREGTRTEEVPVEMEELMEEVFSAVAAMKKAYVSLQAAHSPWDPDRIRAADESVVLELAKLSRLKHRFRRRRPLGSGSNPRPPAPLREAVIPYEAALLEARKELKAKEAVVENLRDELRSTADAATPAAGRKGRFRSSSSARRKSVLLSSSSLGPNPTPELFSIWLENQVNTSSKAFTGHFMASMKPSGVDIIKALVSSSSASSVGSHHSKHAVEAFVNQRTFEGFENETFYMEGSLSSLLNPAAHRQDCFSQFKSMLSIDPSELLGVLPNCTFGNWASKRYRSVVGEHPGGQARGLYGQFLGMAKAVWLLHLLAFAMDPAPTHFEARGGAEFDGEHMESVVRFPGEKVPVGWVVGFGVGLGFRLGDGSVVRARVYPVPPSH